MGQQHSYIDECWTYATTPRSGQQGAAGQQSEAHAELWPCDPDLPQGDRGNLTADAATDKSLLPREPGESPTGESGIEARSVCWAQQAAALLSLIDDDDLRADLRYLFEEREAIACIDGHLSADDAGRLAFGELRGAIQKLGTDYS